MGAICSRELIHHSLTENVGGMRHASHLFIGYYLLSLLDKRFLYLVALCNLRYLLAYGEWHLSGQNFGPFRCCVVGADNKRLRFSSPHLQKFVLQVNLAKQLDNPVSVSNANGKLHKVHLNL